MPTTLNSIAFDGALAIARQLLYRFAAMSLLDPRAGSWELLDGLRSDALLLDAAALVRDMPEAQASQLAPGERKLADLDPSRVVARLPSSPAKFNQEYEDTFGLLVSSSCPPYETEYIDSKLTFQRSNALADVSGFYCAFGLTTSSKLPERPDHIVQELEFMAFLIGLERQAVTTSSPLPGVRLEVCRNAQARFVREHLAWWAPAFARLLSRENPSGYFAAAGVFLSALIPADRSIFGIDAPARPAAPSAMENPEACEGCQLPTA